DDIQIGTYEISFTVEDPLGESETVAVKFVFKNLNEAPFGARILEPANGSKVSLGASIKLRGSCLDPDLDAPEGGETLTYSWTHDGEELGTGEVLTGVILPEGPCTITLTVTDVEGLSASAWVVVEVQNASVADNDGDGIPDATDPDDDNDGMPDDWESEHGLDPNSADDRNGTNHSTDGYTNLEMYLNELAGDPVEWVTTAVRYFRGTIDISNISVTARGVTFRVPAGSPVRAELLYLSGKVCTVLYEGAMRGETMTIPFDRKTQHSTGIRLVRVAESGRVKVVPLMMVRR
ncbi:MAG: hypothetical protein JW863_02440, partial [Chitinispirillaceae bacterium]|nr:hypothetical protein [Chitinispirillaceae bacterium]